MPESNRQTQKLVLLYMLKQIPGLPTNEWMNWAIDSLFLDYFSFAEVREELKRDHFIVESHRKEEKRMDANGQPVVRADLTPEGEVVLAQLLPTLPAHIRTYLTDEAKKRADSETQKNTVLSDYRLTSEGRYAVNLQLIEAANPLFTLTVTVRDEKHAQKICRRWKDSTADIYKTILQTLESEADTPPN